MIDADIMRHLHGESNYLESRVLDTLKEKNDLTDNQIAEALMIAFVTAKAIIQQLVYKGKIERKRIIGGPIQNHLKV